LFLERGKYYCGGVSPQIQNSNCSDIIADSFKVEYKLLVYFIPEMIKEEFK